MPKNQELAATPPPPRALRTIPGARLALARLYHRVERGEVDPTVAGRLTQILTALIASSRDFEFDRRLSELEGKLAEAKPNGRARPNGHARPELHP